MNDSTASKADGRALALGMIMAMLAIGSVWLGFHVGDLGQQVLRAHDLLRGIRGSSTAPELGLIMDSLLDASRSIFAVRLWLFLLGVVAFAAGAVIDWAAVRFRAAAAVFVLVCWIALILTTPLRQVHPERRRALHSQAAQL